jgi:hypothetical protein
VRLKSLFFRHVAPRRYVTGVRRFESAVSYLEEVSILQCEMRLRCLETLGANRPYYASLHHKNGDLEGVWFAAVPSVWKNSSSVL